MLIGAGNFHVFWIISAQQRCKRSNFLLISSTSIMGHLRRAQRKKPDGRLPGTITPNLLMSIFCLFLALLNSFCQNQRSYTNSTSTDNLWKKIMIVWSSTKQIQMSEKTVIEKTCEISKINVLVRTGLFSQQARWKKTLNLIFWSMAHFKNYHRWLMEEKRTSFAYCWFHI